MESFIRTIFPLLLNCFVIFVIIIVEIVLLPFNLLGVYLFEQLYSQQPIFKIITQVAFATLFYDVINLHPIGSLALSYFAVALPVVIVLSIFKFNISESSNNYAVQLARIVLITISAFLQQFLLFKITNIHTIDTNKLLSIAIITCIYSVLIRYMRKKRKLTLLN